MSWTLALLLCIAAYFIVVLFNNTFHIFQRKAFVYPSEAEIDQILPPEIIETIMTYTDLDTLYSCALVSKYWRHHAEKDHIVKDAIRKERPIRVDLSDLKADMDECNRPMYMHLSDLEFLTYDESYKPGWNMRDRRYIERNGKKLVDARYETVLRLKALMGDTLDTRGDQISHKYVARTRLRYSFERDGKYYFYDTKSYKMAYFEPNALPRHVTDELHNNAIIEIVEELANFNTNDTIQISSPSLVRLLPTIKYFAGVPLHPSLFALIFVLFTPCIIKDIWSASDNFRYYTYLICSIIGLTALVIATSGGNEGVNEMKEERDKEKARRIIMTGIFGEIILTVVFYEWTIELGFLCAIELGCFFYLILLFGKPIAKHPLGKQTIFISLCLIISIVDWKSTVDAVRSNEIWLPLGYSLMRHTFLLIWFQLVYSLRYRITKGEFSWAAMKPKELVQIFFLNLPTILYMTCASPYRTHRVLL